MSFKKKSLQVEKVLYIFRDSQLGHKLRSYYSVAQPWTLSIFNLLYFTSQDWLHLALFPFIFDTCLLTNKVQKLGNKTIVFLTLVPSLCLD